MALDATARESNVRDSIKRFFIDNIYKTEGIQLTFDRTLSTPKIQGTEAATRWVSVNFGPMDMDYLSNLILTVYLCTRQDSEGFRLAQLRDTVMGYLSDTDETDGMKRITFYRSRSTGAWMPIGSILVQDVTESGQMLAPDETKYKVLTVRCRFASKI